MTNIQQLQEEWKDIPNYEGLYQVSTLGRVKSLDKFIERGNYRPHFLEGRVMKFIYTSDNRQQVMLYKKGVKRRCFTIHELVFFTFNTNEVKTKGFEVDHIDNNKLNNRLNNLQYISGRANSSKRSLNLPKTSNYTGVSWAKTKGKWQAHIRYNNGTFYLGRYKLEIDAAMAYMTALKEIELGTFKKRERIKPLTSKHIGVSLNKRLNKWIALYKRKYLGVFDTEEEASQAYQNALNQLQNKAA